MKHFYVFIPNSDPLDSRVRVFVFPVGMNQREQGRLKWMQQVAIQRGDFLQMRDNVTFQFLQKLAESLYVDNPSQHWTMFLMKNQHHVSFDFIYNLFFKHHAKSTHNR